MIKKTFNIDIATQFMATRQIFHRAPGAKWFYAFFVGLPLVYLVIAYHYGYRINDNFLPNLPIWIFILATFGFAFIVLPLIQYYEVNKQFHQNKTAQKKQCYDINEKGFRNYGDGFAVEVEWKNIRAVEKTTRFLLFYITKNTAYYIPLQYLDDTEIQAIRSWFDDRAQ